MRIGALKVLKASLRISRFVYLHQRPSRHDNHASKFDSPSIFFIFT